jgi:adiponectin receptor
MSAFYHTFHSMGCECHHFLVKLDYAGISLLILGSTFAPTYYSFACGDARTIGVYMNIFMTFLCGLAFILSLLPISNGDGSHKFLMAIFLTAGISGIIPLLFNNFY